MDRNEIKFHDTFIVRNTSTALKSSKKEKVMTAIRKFSYTLEVCCSLQYIFKRIGRNI